MPADNEKGNHRLLFRVLIAQALALIVLACVSAYLLHSLYASWQHVILAGEGRYRSYLLADQLRHSSDDLTRMVRTYAATGNPIFEGQFRDVLAIRGGTKPRPNHYDRIYWDFMAVENPTAPFEDGEAVSLEALMREAGFTDEEFSLLAESKQRSDKLVELEETAVNALRGEIVTENGDRSNTGEPDSQLALQILFGKEYHEAKKGIMEPINEFLRQIDERTQQQVTQGSARASQLLSRLVTSFTATIAIAFLLLGSTYQYHRLMVDDLRLANHGKSEQIVEINGLVDKLESKNAELERFTYTVSHDLKSPLITISGFAGQLREDLNDDRFDEIGHYLDRITNAGKHMESLLDDLLELSRIGRIVNPPEELKFDELAASAVELLSGVISKKGVTVTIDPAEHLVHGDRMRLLEVLQNLIENAVKYGGDQPDPQIGIGARVEGTETVFHIRDNGIGIKPAYHDKIFHLFDQLDPKVEGTGVGLPIVKRIIELHRGRVWVESEGLGQGTTFRFTLPGIQKPPRDPDIARKASLNS